MSQIKLTHVGFRALVKIASLSLSCLGLMSGCQYFAHCLGSTTDALIHGHIVLFLAVDYKREQYLVC